MAGMLTVPHPSDERGVPATSAASAAVSGFHLSFFSPSDSIGFLIPKFRYRHYQLASNKDLGSSLGRDLPVESQSHQAYTHRVTV
jgi:hypothetical protein